MRSSLVTLLWGYLALVVGIMALADVVRRRGSSSWVPAMQKRTPPKLYGAITILGGLGLILLGLALLRGIGWLRTVAIVITILSLLVAALTAVYYGMWGEDPFGWKS